MTKHLSLAGALFMCGYFSSAVGSALPPSVSGGLPRCGSGDAESRDGSRRAPGCVCRRRPPATDQNLIGWVYRVALRKARRSRGRAGAVQLRAVSAEDGRLGATLDALEVGRLLDLLTHRQRVVVVAHYFLGLTQLEIAERLGIKRGTVGATITQSLSRMRREAGHVR